MSYCSVGRIDLEDEDIHSLEMFPTILDVLRQAYSSGFKLIYLLSPPQSVDSNGIVTTVLPGKLVDMKTTYNLTLDNLDTAKLCGKAFTSKAIRIKRHAILKESQVSRALLDLSIASGSYSRFNVDDKIPKEGYRSLFEAWITNSLNHSVADEVFVAYTTDSNEEVGFITVKRKENVVNIGLLAVNESFRRLGIATALLSRASLWALEEIGSMENATLSVITQGTNAAACTCYERFGLIKTTIQQVYHVWLPDDLVEPISRADRDPIPFCRQHLTGKENNHVAQLLTTGLDSAAHYNLICSARLQELLGRDCSRALIVPSGTAALEFAALLCDLQPGDEVIMPSYTFSSTANAFVLRRAVPVFVDLRPDTCNIDETLIEAAITDRTKAICAVHYAGVPCEMDTICAIAAKYNLVVIEDAAQGFMAKYKGRPLGSIGHFGCLSFHYTKNVICGEGGALSINRSPEMVRKAMVMWEKGTNRYDFMMGKISKYEWIDVGCSFVPSEISCAVLWSQLEEAQSITNRRLEHFHAYQEAFQPLVERGLMKVSTVPADCIANAHIFFIVLPSVESRQVMEASLRKRGISAFTHYVPLHAAPAGKRFGRVGSTMKVTMDVDAGLLRLPVWTDMTTEQVQQVIDAVREIAEGLLL